MADKTGKLSKDSKGTKEEGAKRVAELTIAKDIVSTLSSKSISSLSKKELDDLVGAICSYLGIR